MRMSSVVLMVAVVASSVMVIVPNCGNAIAHGKALVGCGSDGRRTTNRNGVTIFIVGAAVVTDFKLEIVSGFGGSKSGKAEAADTVMSSPAIEVRRHSND